MKPILPQVTGLLLLLGFVGGSGISLAAQDLDVTHISRTPLYFRYNVQYPNGYPVLAPVPGGNADPSQDKRWPDPGETVTFTAHLRNHGDTPTAPFTFTWMYDGTEVASGSHADPIPPGEEATESYSMPWPSDTDDHFIRFTAVPGAGASDFSSKNDTIEDPIWGLSYSIWVEEGLYDRFNTVKNFAGTFSFEDWYNKQFAAFRTNFHNSTYPLDPLGVTEQVRVDKFVVMPSPPDDLGLWRQVMAADPDLYRNDGRWQFTSEAGTYDQKQTDWDNYVATFANQVDWGLLHEMTHQLGIIDEYRMNTNPGLVQVKDKNGKVVDFNHLFPHSGLMGGGSVLPHTNGNFYSSHTAHALNVNRRFRRGYYGEYLWDIPKNNTLLFTDAFGRPLPDAQIAIFQKARDSEVMSNTPVMTGMTDAEGKYPMKNRTFSQKSVRTATGHFLNPNPFGFVSVVGENGLLLVRIRSGAGEDWRWMDLTDFNLAYWAGQTENATYTLPTYLLPGMKALDANVAQDKTAKASVMTTQAKTVVDGSAGTGGTEPHWEPNPSSKGTWWQVDLGDTYSVGQVNILGGVWNAHDSYRKFHIDVSATGQFKGEQKTVYRETGWDVARGWLSAGAFGHGNWVEYHFKPTPGRYVRLVADVDQPFVRLQEVQVFEAAVPGDVNADGSVDVLDTVSLLQTVVGLTPETPAVRAAGDLAPVAAPDGAITVEDAVATLRMILGLPLS